MSITGCGVADVQLHLTFRFSLIMFQISILEASDCSQTLIFSSVSILLFKRLSLKIKKDVISSARKTYIFTVNLLSYFLLTTVQCTNAL